MSDSVLFCGAWDEGPGYPRTTSLQNAVAAAGFEVRRCRVPSLGRDKQRVLRQPWLWPQTAWRSRARRRQLVEQLRQELLRETPRCIVVPYPGHHVVGAVRRATDVPVVLDLFLSAYDTVIEDRRLAEPGSLAAAYLAGIDRRACEAADLVLLDTPENAAYVAALTGLPAERFAWLPVNDPDAPAQPAPWRGAANGALQLLFFGTGVPLHGLSTLLAAVASVPRVHLTLVGGTAADRAEAQRLLPGRLRLEPEFVDRQRLAQLLDECQLVAGVFGESGKAQRVVPFKVVHALAAGRPVLTADTPAVCRWLEGSGAVFLTPAANVGALAGMLRQLGNDPQQVRAAAAAARPAYDRTFSLDACRDRWAQLVAGLDGAALECVG
ncbi:MAG: glycosyltransferase family 4 protein [Planctomycetes bacterium]|nr:glycosyltransferase family 4 protein [Planctomycetota bacterium]